MSDPGMPYAHPLALIESSVRLGQGTKVWAFSSVHDGTETGPNCSIGERCYIGWHVRMGESVRIQDNSHITSRAQIGHRVFIGPSVTMTDDKHPIVNNPLYKPLPPIIEDDVSIGAGAILLPGVHLGRGCVIGAGAVVTRDVPPYETWIGSPARPLKKKEIA